MLFSLLSAADVDLNNADAMEVLRPLFPILDRAWLVPVHVSENGNNNHVKMPMFFFRFVFQNLA